MAHEHTTENLSPEELKYRDLVQRGEDYHKIELYRWALHYYKLAMETPFHDGALDEKVETVKRKIRKETRSILSVLGVAVVIILLIWLLS